MAQQIQINAQEPMKIDTGCRSFAMKTMPVITWAIAQGSGFRMSATVQAPLCKQPTQISYHAPLLRKLTCLVKKRRISSTIHHSHRMIADLSLFSNKKPPCLQSWHCGDDFEATFPAAQRRQGLGRFGDAVCGRAFLRRSLLFGICHGLRPSM